MPLLLIPATSHKTPAHFLETIAELEAELERLLGSEAVDAFAPTSARRPLLPSITVDHYSPSQDAAGASGWPRQPLRAQSVALTTPW
jgi:hypothetical protein